MADWVSASEGELKQLRLYGVRGWLLLFVVVAILQALVGAFGLWGTTTVTTTLDGGESITGTAASRPIEGFFLLVGAAIFLWPCLTKRKWFYDFGAPIIWLPWFFWTASWVLTEPTFSLIEFTNNGDVVTSDSEGRNQLAAALNFFSGVFCAVWFVYAVILSFYIRRSKRVRMTYLKMKPA